MRFSPHCGPCAKRHPSDVNTRDPLQELTRLAEESPYQLRQYAEDLRRLYRMSAQVRLDRDQVETILQESRRIVEEARRVEPLLGRENQTSDAQTPA